MKRDQAPGWRRREVLHLLSGGAAWTLAQAARAETPLPEVAGYLLQTEESAVKPQAPVVPLAKALRAMEFEFHSPAQSRFDIDLETVVGKAKAAGAQSIMFYTQDHWGYAFYPTRVGVRHPSLDYDLVGRILDSVHRHGLSAVAYYSVHFNNQIVFSHPDWAMREKDGKEHQFTNRWFVTCLHSPYRDYVRGMIKEIFTQYPFDGLFLDIFGINIIEYYIGLSKNPLCYCFHTQEAWEKETGTPYLKGIETPEGWKARYEWTKKTMLVEPLEEVLAVVRDARPNLVVTLNGGPLWIPSDILNKLDYIFAEPIFSSTGISISSIISRGWLKPDYQSGVWGRLGYQDLFPAAIQRAEADALLVQNARVFLIGGAGVLGILPEGGYAHHWMDNAQETFADAREVQHLLIGLEPVLSLGVVLSESTKEYLATQQHPMRFRHSVLGALELMTYTHYPVEVIPEWQLRAEILKDYDAIVLPETEALSEAAGEALRHYVQEGGTLVTTGKCGLVDDQGRPRSNFLLSDVLGVNYVEEITEYAAHLQTDDVYDRVAIYLEATDHPLAQGLGAREVGVPGPFVKIAGQAETVFRYLLPAMVEDISKHQWWNWDSPPPSRTQAGPAVTYHRFGRGQALYIGVPLFQVFQEQWYWVQHWVLWLIRQLVPNPILRFQMDAVSLYAHGTFLRQKETRRILAQVVNMTEMSLRAELAPLPGVTIIGDARRIKVARARMLYPRKQTLFIERHAEEFHVRVREFGRYTLVVLETA